MTDDFSLANAHANARRHLLAMRNRAGYWEGELSTSALSTATAVVALGSVDEGAYSKQIRAGVTWLVENQNEDGGWGDTIRSYSNISTTLLCWAALSRFEGDKAAQRKATHWILDYVGSLSPGAIAETVKARYGKDRTFSVPILMHCAICGVLGKDGWSHVLRLPFELAVFPRDWFAAMRLPVVSYALPALIAIGYAGHRNKRGYCGLGQWWKGPFWNKASRLLEEIQPSSGGFLEAAPLSSFVTMALASAGEKDHPVVRNAVRFLLDGVRPDGSWPIDTNLATWATTLSVKALCRCGETVGKDFDRTEGLVEWLLSQQYTEIHPFTNTPPGGWAWTDLPGGVPDGDDTPGALLALDRLRGSGQTVRIERAVGAAVTWLLDLQNRDGGIPTFCRGWGALPFDRSSPDLTAHTLRAWHSWRKDMPVDIQNQIDRATAQGIRYLRREQRPDGSWVPLWFGNQDRRDDEENPTYGTATVVKSLREIGERDLASGGIRWLLNNQNSDGGWGASRDRTPSTIEETALAVTAVSRARTSASDFENTIRRGTDWLIAATENGRRFDASPVGFYFAKLWYYEKIYPVVWTVEAFAAASTSPPIGE